MGKQTERRFGEIPDWAKTGPIDLKNYDYRAEWHCADRSPKRGGAHPIIKLGSPEFPAWHEYFVRHLGGVPWAMKALIAGDIESFTAPEQMPQWFDPSFEPTLGYRPVLPRDPEVSEERRFTRYSDDELRKRYAEQCGEKSDACA